MAFIIITTIGSIISLVLGLTFLSTRKYMYMLVCVVVSIILIILLNIEVDGNRQSHVDVHPVTIEGVIPNYTTAGSKVQVRGQDDTVVEDYIVSYYPELLVVDNPGVVVTFYKEGVISHYIYVTTEFYPFEYDSKELKDILSGYEVEIK